MAAWTVEHCADADCLVVIGSPKPLYLSSRPPLLCKCVPGADGAWSRVSSDDFPCDHPRTVDKPYFRFWSGQRLASLTRDQFSEGMEFFLNQTATISNCGGLSLYIVPLVDNSDDASLPDEIALLHYRSEALYHEFYATPIGQYYQNLHAKFFNMSVSHSLVPQDENTTFAVNQAYCIPNCSFTWTMYFAASLVLRFTSPPALQQLQKTVTSFLSLDNAPAALVVGIYETYVKIVTFFKSESDIGAASSDLEDLLLQYGQFVGPAVQPARNVVPPLHLEFGSTVNVTIGPCKFDWNKTRSQ